MKAHKITLALGAGLLIGGVSYTYVMGYNAFVPTLWIEAIPVAFTNPSLVIGQAISGANTPLFQGVAMVSVGIMLLIFSAAFLVFKKVSGKSSGLKKIKLKKPKNESLEDRTDKGFEFADEQVQSTKTTTSRISSMLQSKKADAEFSEYFEDEKTPESKEKWTKNISRMFASIKNRSSRQKPKTNTIKIKKSAQENAIQKKMDVVWDSLLTWIKSRLSKKAQENSAEQIVAVDSDQVPDSFVLEWFENVEKSAKPPSELVREAILIRDSLGEDLEEGFVLRNSSNGAFISRMVRSWASIKNPQMVQSSSDNKDAWRQAIRSSMRGREGLETFRDDEVPAEFQTPLDEESTHSEEESWEKEYQEKTDEDARISVSDSGEVAVQKNEYDLLKELVVRMRMYVRMLDEVKSGNEEWPEYLADQEDRDDAVALIAKDYISVSIFLTDDEIVGYASGSEDEDLEWLVENIQILDIGFADFVKRREEGVDEESYEDESSEENGKSTSVLEEVFAQDDQADEVTPAPLFPVQAEQDSAEDAAEEASIVPQQEDQQEGVSSTVGNISDEETAQEEDDFVADEGVEAKVVSTERDEGLEEEDEIKSEPKTENSDEDAHVANADLVVSKEVKIEEVLPVVEEMKEPENKSLGELQEMKMASALVPQWVELSKAIKATKGTMMRFVSEKTEEGVMPVGVFNLVMAGERDGGELRVNVMFKYLPEGKWTATGNEGMFYNESGDWIGVEESLLNHQEAKSALNIMHLHGPGATNETIESAIEWKKIWAVQEVPDEKSVLSRI